MRAIRSDASTPPDAQAKQRGAEMTRIFLIVVVIGILLLAGGLVYLGTFPPNLPQHPVEKVLPNDKFQSH